MLDEEKIIPYQDGQEDACPKDPQDDRDCVYDEIVAAAAPVKIDWEKGFDIRNILGGKIPFKLQFQSLSCVGQGWAYYIWVKQVIEMMSKYGMNLSQLRIAHKDEVDEVSAKAIYSQIFIESTGGAYIRSGAKLVTNWGSLFEKIVPSINPATNMAEEDFMRDKTWKTEALDSIAKTLQGLEYAVIIAAYNMDLFAQAILENNGVVGGIKGQRGREWNTENPLAPTGDKPLWGHCIYYGAFGTDDKGRFIATPNSWGNAFQHPIRNWKLGDPPGDGWQKLRVDYFNTKWQFNPWTYVDKLNPSNDMITNVKIIKDVNSSACGIWLPATSPEALESYCLNFGIKIPKKEDGSIDWENWIDGKLTLKNK